MQCSKCGAVLDADTVFCPECGAMAVDMTIHQPEKPRIAEVEAPEKMQKEIPVKLPSEWKIWAKRYRGFLATLGATVGVLLITAIVIVAIALQPGDYTAAVENYIEIAYEGNFEKLDLLVPEEYWDYMGQKNHFGLAAYKKECELIFLQMRFFMASNCGEDMEISYEIMEEKPVNGEDLDKIRGYLATYGIKSTSVKSAYAIGVKMNFSGSKGTDEANLANCYAILIGDCWYLAYTDLNTIGFYIPFRGGDLLY